MNPTAEELGKIFYLALLEELQYIDEELSDFEMKRLIQKALEPVPGLRIEWADTKLGKNTLLVQKEKTLLIIESSPLVHTLRILWNETVQARRALPA